MGSNSKIYLDYETYYEAIGYNPVLFDEKPIRSGDFKTLSQLAMYADKPKPNLCNNLELRLIFIALCNERLNRCLSMKTK